MIITWLGHSCFKIQDKIGADNVTVAIDPFDKSIGLKVPKFEADILTISHDHSDHNNQSAIKGNPFIIKEAGEYEIKGVSIDGIESYHDDKQGKERGKNIIYRFEISGITVTHLGDLGRALDEQQISKLEGTDILLIPIGGVYTIDAKKAVEVVSQIEPRIIIPMHYKIPGLKININGVGAFIKELGVKPTYEEKLKISKKDLPVEDMELVMLNA